MTVSNTETALGVVPHSLAKRLGVDVFVTPERVVREVIERDLRLAVALDSRSRLRGRPAHRVANEDGYER